VREAGAERCADEEGLRHAVAGRLGYDPFFVWAHVTVVAHVRKEAGGFRAEVTLVDDGGVSRGTRTLATQGDDCAPLVSALALTVSLALDPLSLKPHAAPETPPAPPSADAPLPRPPPAEPPPVDGAPTPAPPARREAAAPPAWRGWLGVGAAGAAGLTPGVALGGLVRAKAVHGGFSVALEAAADLPTETSVAGHGSVRAWAARATALGCARVPLIVACAFVSAGPVIADGVGVSAPRSAVVPFVAVGPRIATQWSVGPRLLVEAFGEVGIALSRRALQVDGVDAFLQPAATPRLGLVMSTSIF
jgi:hypothetical protein